MNERGVMPSRTENAIFEIGAFNPRVVRELAALPEPVRRLKAVEAAAIARREDVRIHATPVEVTKLMRTIVARRRFDVSLNEEDGHSYIDVHAGEGVVGAIIDLVASAIDAEEISFATVCIGKNSLSFYPSPSGDSPALAA
jgi:hypothetical protein